MRAGWPVMIAKIRSIGQRKCAGCRLAKFQANNLSNSDRHGRAGTAVRLEVVRAAIVQERRAGGRNGEARAIRYVFDMSGMRTKRLCNVGRE